ncbi:MAG: hypothetical protein ACI9FJ_001036, partial [Alteromonadaceae bacterium]
MTFFKPVSQSIIKSFTLWVSFSLCLAVPLSSLAAFDDNSKAIPEALKQWVPWVLKGQEAIKCPAINHADFTNPKNHVCAWPSALDLTANDNGGTFSQSWHVIVPSWITLPGGQHHWPQGITINGKPVPVVTHHARPALYLTAGRYQVKGRFDWQRLPQSLKIPATYAFVNITVNGKTIAFPKLESGELWLSELEVDETERDNVTVYVSRKVKDGAYIDLETRITLNVSGKMREVALGKILPPQFKLKQVSGNVSAFLAGDGVLHAKLKPGNGQIIVYAYAQPTQLSWQRPERTHLWPEEEVWVFKADDQLRTGKLSGGTVIDANLADLPNDWLNLPAYVFKPNDTFEYQITHRGRPLGLENRLTLKRQLWLSFDRSEYAFNDDITGSMIRDWRLSMSGPFILQSGEDQDGNVLITSSSAEPDERGIENRYPNVSIKASGITPAKTQLPVTGWDSHFESLSLTLNLPPATRLFGVFGADSVSGSWLEQWTIWACFIILFTAILAGRIINISTGVITLITLIFVYHEAATPIAAVINLLLAIALAKYQPFNKLKSIARSYFAISLFAAVASVLYFSAIQLRTVIHPQLEETSQQVMYDFDEFSPGLADDGTIMEEPMARAPSTQQRAYKIKRAVTEIAQQSAMEQITVTGSRIKNADVLQRYQTDALIQTGQGIPNWQWHQYQIDWTSPVAKNQQADFIIIGGALWVAFKMMAIVLSLLWLYNVLKPTVGNLLGKGDLPCDANSDPDPKPKADAITAAPVVALIALMLLPLSSSPTQAADFPSQQLLNELEKRLTQPQKCHPQCAVINTINVNAAAHHINLKMTIHALADTAIALPGAVFWRPEQLTVNGKKQLALYRRNNWVYVPVNKGITTIEVGGRIAPVDHFQLKFNQLPKWIKLDKSSFWDVLGTKDHSLTGNTLEFTAAIPKTAKGQNPSALSSQSSRYTMSPFVRVERQLSIDPPWRVQTIISRIAPAHGSISTKIAILPGEQITSREISIEQGFVEVTIPAGKDAFSWQSTLQQQAQLVLSADTSQKSIEQWQILSSPNWHVQLSGLPVILEQQDNDDYFGYTFYPQSGEKLTLDISRPKAVKGETLAIDKVYSTLEQGKRTTVLDIIFNYRSTRGGEHTIELPPGFELKEIASDGRIINLQPQDLKLAIPISPGKHQISLNLRAN